MSASNRIQSLPLHLANQIAAGEVIERPASVVKELVENSMDAGASQIFIDIEGAGSQLIRVRDNGEGIHRDDLSLALSRHATSKLHSSDQLSHIASLGFRGEALPSIASISQLNLSSRQQDDECGWQVSANIETISPVAHPIGTTVEVHDLFFNVPARRHFLRGNKTEQHHIATTIHRLALCQFEIGFQCQLSASSSIKLPVAITAEQQQQRIAKICGKSFINNSLFIQQQYDDIELKGWLGTAQAHRPQTDVNYFYINGRVIRDRVINHAIRQAYSDLIPVGRYPAFVLYLTMPLDRVDINVHPTKHEVRFRDARLIHGLITKAIQEALASSMDTPSVDHPNTSYASELQTNSHIAEQTHHYQNQPILSSHNISTDDFGSITALLHQRYVITQSTQDLFLIDLQMAEHSLRRQQLELAIKTNSLSTRPILVPIKVSLSTEQHQAVIKNRDLLLSLGLDFQEQDNHLVIKSIPSLLAQVEIKQLIHSIANTLSNDHTKIEQLTTVLKRQLPLIPIQNVQHAESLIKQLSISNNSTIWCRRLDQKTLSSLF
ncbi:MAG: DNA mismatch repair endonuclease MutL [Gammaproteobacteria bacterium]|nr:MAG: DNA mismatch repair endonuclease MutL [Gammaproteobacteria bacterium]